MRKGWIEATLGDIAEVLDRFRKPISGAERDKRLGDIPYYGATGQTGWIDDSLFNEELVLLGEDAIDFLNPDVHKAYLIDGPSWVNNHAHVLRARKDKIMSFFLMESLNAVDYSQFVAFGTRSKLTQGSMMGITLHVPPLSEQKRIVDLVSSVDAYIAALQRQVDVARAARSAMLSELLSAGGDDWTETTPKVKKLEDFASLKRGHDLPSQARTEGAFPVVASNGAVGFHNDFIGPIPGVVTGRSGTIGKVFYLEGGYWPLNTTLYVTDFKGNNERFVAFTLEKMGLERFAGGTTVPSLDRKVLRRELVFAPDVAEQQAIVDTVSSVDDVIQSTELAVAEAKKVRSGLLSELLSGEHVIPESYDRLLGAA